NGRLHRIGQVRPVSVVASIYADTTQQVMLELVAKKVSTSLQVDGLDVQAALEAAGVGTDEGLELALSIGQAIYRAPPSRCRGRATRARLRARIGAGLAPRNLRAALSSPHSPRLAYDACRKLST